MEARQVKDGEKKWETGRPNREDERELMLGKAEGVWGVLSVR